MTTDATTTSPLDDALRFDAVDLVGRTGTHRRVEHTVPAPAREAGGLAMQVAEGDPIAIELELESVVEGIYAHGTVTAHLEGECSRCLDPVDQDIATRFDELFLYPEKVKAEEREDSVLLVDDEVRLGPVVRDTLAVEADERPDGRAGQVDHGHAAAQHAQALRAAGAQGEVAESGAVPPVRAQQLLDDVVGAVADAAGGEHEVRTVGGLVEHCQIGRAHV